MPQPDGPTVHDASSVPGDRRGRPGQHPVERDAVAALFLDRQPRSFEVGSQHQAERLRERLYRNATAVGHPGELKTVIEPIGKNRYRVWLMIKAKEVTT